MKLPNTWGAFLKFFLLLLLALAGVGFFLCVDRIFKADLKAQDKINDSIIWITAVLVAWYSWETLRLRQEARDEISLSKEQIKTTILLNRPIINPVFPQGRQTILKSEQNGGWLFDDSSGSKTFMVRNEGRGMAIDPRLFLEKKEIGWMQKSTLPVDQNAEFLTDTKQSLFIKDFVDKHKSGRVKITYKDLFGNFFITEFMVAHAGNSNPELSNISSKVEHKP